MFISKRRQILAALAVAAASVALWGGFLSLVFSAAIAEFVLFCTWPLAALTGYTAGLSLLPEGSVGK